MFVDSLDEDTLAHQTNVLYSEAQQILVAKFEIAEASAAQLVQAFAGRMKDAAIYQRQLLLHIGPFSLASDLIEDLRSRGSGGCRG